MIEMTIAETLFYTTTKITTWANGRATGSGTGFFFSIQLDETTIIPILVTNKHVIRNSDLATITCHIAKNGAPSGEVVECRMTTEPDKIYYHPDNNVDLCALAFGPIINSLRNQGKDVFLRSMDMSLVPDNDDWDFFDAIEDVTMIGCPSGIYDQLNNIPIIRRGITATPISKRYLGRNEFMVDMACFPGSSGSPVVVLNRDGYLDRRTNSYRMGAPRLKLVGILYSGPQVTNTGEIILGKPPSVSVPSMMHLGNVIRSSELSVIVEQVKGMMNNARDPDSSQGL